MPVLIPLMEPSSGKGSELLSLRAKQTSQVHKQQELPPSQCQTGIQEVFRS